MSGGGTPSPRTQFSCMGELEDSSVGRGREKIRLLYMACINGRRTSQGAARSNPWEVSQWVSPESVPVVRVMEPNGVERMVPYSKVAISGDATRTSSRPGRWVGWWDTTATSCESWASTVLGKRRAENLARTSGGGGNWSTPWTLNFQKLGGISNRKIVQIPQLGSK